MNTSWNSDDNVRFYNSLTVEELRGFADTLGMSTCPEVEHLQKEVVALDHVLEVGSGYGRFARRLLGCFPTVSIIGVEPIVDYVRELQLVVPAIDIRPSVLRDAARAIPSESVDLVAFPWSGFTEFPPSEHQEVLGIVRRVLRKGGMLMVDMPAPEAKTIAEIVGNWYRIKLGERVLHGYTPDPSEMLRIVGSFSRIVIRRYESKPGRPRLFYLFWLS